MGEIIVFPIWRVRGARWSGKDVDALLAILELISRPTACSSQPDPVRACAGARSVCRRPGGGARRPDGDD